MLGSAVGQSEWDRDLESKPNDTPLMAVALLPLCLISVGARFFVPQFLTVYQSFGAELPLATRLLLQTYQGWPLIPLLYAAIWLVLPRHQLRAPVLLICGLALAGTLFAFMIYACYAPILALANVV